MTARHPAPAAEDVAWAQNCLSRPSLGVDQFLKRICEVGEAQFAHIRIVSRSGDNYLMVDSVGPYLTIGWPRRARLLDEGDRGSLSYKLFDHSRSRDCQRLQEKYAAFPDALAYLTSLGRGVWIPLDCCGVELGYLTLSWTTPSPTSEIVDRLQAYMELIKGLLPILFSACRSVLADRQLRELWTRVRTILSATTEAQCHDRLAAACIEFWGQDTTCYVGTLDPPRRIDVVSVRGRRADEADPSRETIPWGEGLFGFALSSEEAVLSRSIASDERFRYHSMRPDCSAPGSAIAIGLRPTSEAAPLAVVSVEHERDSYFDTDDLRYLNGLGRIGAQALSSLRHNHEEVTRQIDELATQVAHDVAEPLQALVADADVLRDRVVTLRRNAPRARKRQAFADITDRSWNILETSLELSKVVRRTLDAGVDGAATRIVAGRVNLFRVLNSLVGAWQERAARRGVELRALFDSLRGVSARCDEGELSLALGHLLGNAIKYSYAGHRRSEGESSGFGRHVSIVGRVSMERATVEFQNFGVGILRGELEAVKEKFYRGQLAVKEGRAGTGRGLWSADLFFRGAGGGVVVSSEYKGHKAEEGGGPYFTCVQAWIPCKIGAEVANG